MASKAKAKQGKARRRPAGSRRTVAQAAATRRETVEQANTRVVEAIKNIVNAQFGVYAEIYDEVSARLTKVRSETPRHWKRLVRRGEQVQKEVKTAQADLKKSLERALADLQRKLARVQEDLRKRMEKLAQE